MNEAETLVKKITEGIQEKKGKNIVIADLTAINDTICSYFVICQGNSPSQVTAIVDSVKEYVHKEINDKPTGIDGLRNAEWLQWTTVMYWYMSFCRKQEIFIIWNIYGQMPN